MDYPSFLLLLGDRVEVSCRQKRRPPTRNETSSATHSHEKAFFGRGGNSIPAYFLLCDAGLQNRVTFSATSKIWPTSVRPERCNLYGEGYHVVKDNFTVENIRRRLSTKPLKNAIFTGAITIINSGLCKTVRPEFYIEMWCLLQFFRFWNEWCAGDLVETKQMFFWGGVGP